MRHCWTILCRKAIVDQATNAVTLIESIEAIAGKGTAPVQPEALPLELTVATLWCRSTRGEAETGTARLRLLAPDGKQLACSEYPVDLTTHERRRNFLTFNGIPFRGAGRYDWSVEERIGEDWAEVSKIPLDIEVEVEIVPVQ